MSFASPRLNAVLSAELAAGNRVDQEGPGWGGMTRLVILGEPFRTGRRAVTAGLEFREVRDPHHWLAEIEDPATGELLACRFLEGACLHCVELQLERPIRDSDELTQAIRMAQASVAAGALEEIGPGWQQLRRRRPSAALSATGPFPEVVERRFRCRTCGTEFELHADTIRGSAGSWRARRAASRRSGGPSP